MCVCVRVCVRPCVCVLSHPLPQTLTVPASPPRRQEQGTVVGTRGSGTSSRGWILRILSPTCLVMTTEFSSLGDTRNAPWFLRVDSGRPVYGEFWVDTSPIRERRFPVRLGPHSDTLNTDPTRYPFGTLTDVLHRGTGGVPGPEEGTV